MALVNWLLLVSGLLVASTGLYLYGTYPFLALPTPWGPWPLYLLLPGAFLLGLGVGGFTPWASPGPGGGSGRPPGGGSGPWSGRWPS
nr:hypothetical protein [Thermus parvatiensis]